MILYYIITLINASLLFNINSGTKEATIKKKSLYIILTLVISVIIFTTAAICTQCGANIDKAIGGLGSNVDEEPPAEEPPGEEPPEGESEAPTIELTIHEGPLYEEDGGICYYRIKATVTGNPEPVIEFSEDFSDGTLGDDIAQVNLYDPGETYTLTATATNTIETAEYSIDITWGCEEPGAEPEPEPGPEEEVLSEEIMQLIAISPLSEDGWEDYYGHFTAFVGDDEFDRQVKGILSFGNHEQFEELYGVEVVEVFADIPNFRLFYRFSY
jgi:hypothetical protein